MARIRTIKPKFWDDVKIGKLSRDARLLYIGMWNFCDDLGVIIAEPIWLKSKIFPYDQIQLQLFERWIQELAKNGFISLLSVKSDKFYYLPKFARHQLINRPNYEDVNLSKDLLDNELSKISEQSVNNHGLITDESVPIYREDKEKDIYISPYNPPKGEMYDIQENEVSKNSSKYLMEEKEKSCAKKEKEPNYFFDAFWELYDKKVGKKDSLIKKWLKLSDKERESAMSYIPKYKQSQPNKKYRKNPETFLNQKAWNDEIIFDNENRQLPASNQIGTGKSAGNSSGNDAANKRAELDNLEKLAEAVLRGSPPSFGQ